MCCSTFSYDTRVRIGVECLRACDGAMTNMHKLQLPLLVFHSTADTLTDPDGSKLLVDSVKVSRRHMAAGDMRDCIQCCFAYKLVGTRCMQWC